MPFHSGGKSRLVSVDMTRRRCSRRGCRDGHINTVNAQDLILPTARAKLGTLEYQRRNERQPEDDRGAERSAG